LARASGQCMLQTILVNPQQISCRQEGEQLSKGIHCS
jgi:hypothetical protein